MAGKDNNILLLNCCTCSSFVLCSDKQQLQLVSNLSISKVVPRTSELIMKDISMFDPRSTVIANGENPYKHGNS